MREGLEITPMQPEGAVSKTLKAASELGSLINAYFTLTYCGFRTTVTEYDYPKGREEVVYKRFLIVYFNQMDHLPFKKYGYGFQVRCASRYLWEILHHVTHFRVESWIYYTVSMAMSTPLTRRDSKHGWDLHSHQPANTSGKKSPLYCLTNEFLFVYNIGMSTTFTN